MRHKETSGTMVTSFLLISRRLQQIGLVTMQTFTIKNLVDGLISSAALLFLYEYSYQRGISFFQDKNLISLSLSFFDYNFCNQFLH